MTAIFKLHIPREAIKKYELDFDDFKAWCKEIKTKLEDDSPEISTVTMEVLRDANA